MKKKFILDACCGGRMFWYDKQHPNVLYIDKRKRSPGFLKERPLFNVTPDEVGDFRKLKYKSKSFKLVVFDPPHIIRKNIKENAIMKKRYGVLKESTWKNDIKKGLSECYRVLEDYGILIFKWNEETAKIGEVLDLIPIDPLFGQRRGSRDKTHWLCFMKIPNKK